MISKYPFTKQEGLKDCASASLQMIIKYYNGYVSLDELNVLLKTTKNGTNAYDLIEAAKKLGFDSEGIKVSLKELNEDNVILPLIAHTIIDSKYKHFVVIYKINFRKKYLIVADPQTKIKKLSFSEFEKIFNNVIITFIPIKPITCNNEVNIKNLFLELLQKYKKEITHLFIISFIYMLLAIITSFYVKIIFDNVNYDKKLLYLIFSLFIILNFIKLTSNYLRLKLLIFINQKIDVEINMDAIKNVINLPYQYYRNRTTGEILSKLMDIGKVREMINKVIMILFVDFPLTLIAMIILLFINKILFVVSIIFLLLYILIIVCTRKIINEKTENCYQSKADVVSYIQESINGFETVKSLAIENKVIRKYEIKYIKYLKKVISLDNLLNLQNYLKEFIGVMSELIILFVGTLLMKKSIITLGTLLAFNSIQIFFFTPIRNIIDLDISFIEAKKVLKKVYEMFKAQDETKVLKMKINGEININNLSYEYGIKKVLDKITFNVKKGEKVILLGNSGSGKSTIFKILMGYFKVARDNVFLDNVDINDIFNINENISYISQNESLFTDTIYNNICIYDNKDKFDIIKECYVDKIVENDNLGLNKVLEENGFNISGGQKQRIILARALLKKFNILLIDEGLNQIDIDLERKILINMFKRYKEKTIIVISHRKENIDLYDHVIEMENGKIKKDVLQNA